MAEVIEALLISLNLDPSQFVKATRQVRDEWKKTKDESVSHGKAIEGSAKSMEQSIAKVSGAVLGLFAILASGRGFKQLIEDINTANASLGRFSANLGLAPQAVGALTTIIKEFGGSAGDAQSALEGANAAIQRLKTYGGGALPELSMMLASVRKNLNDIDFDHGSIKYLESIAPILQQLNKIDPAKAHTFAQALSIPDSMANAMIAKGAGLAAALDAHLKYQASGADIEAAQKLQAAWADLGEHAGALGNKITTDLDGPLEKLATDLSGIVDQVTSFWTWMDRVNDQSKNWWITKLLNAAQNPNLGPRFTTPSQGAVDDFMNSKLFKGGGTRGLTIGGKEISLERADDPIFGPGGTRGIEVSGGDVSEANPLPVTVVPRGGSGFGLMDWIGAALGGPSGASTSASAPSGPYADALKAISGGGPQGGAGRAVGGWWTPDRIKTAASYLMKNAGLTAEGAAGLVARWAGIESPGGPGSVNPYSGALGIAQGLGSRRAGYGGDFESQLANAARELNTTEKRAGDALRAARTVADGARGASMFERAEGYRASTGIDNFTGKTPVQRVLDILTGTPASLIKGGANSPQIEGTGFGNIPNAGDSRKNSWNPRTGRFDVPFTYPAMGAGFAAALNSIGNQYNATTSSSANSMHIGAINISAPNATDAQSIAGAIEPALAKHVFAQFANTGPM